MAATQEPIFVGASNAGLALTFAVFADASTGSPLTKPTITESPSGGGWYTFPYDWSTAPAGVTRIQWSLTANGSDFGDVIFPTPSSTQGVYIPPAPGLPLPGEATLASLRLLAKQRADMENSGFVSDAEWLSYLNGSYAELYNLLIEKFGADYYAPEIYPFTTSGTADTYPLPDGSGTYLQLDGITAARPFFKLCGLDVAAPGTASGWLSLKPFMMGERNSLGVAGQFARRPRYRLAKNALWFRPVPQPGLSLRVLYAPRLIPLLTDADLVDGVSGWEELIVVDAARKALLKEEGDTSGVEREKAAIIARIEHEADNRDQGEPATVADVQRGGYDLVDPWGLP